MKSIFFGLAFTLGSLSAVADTSSFHYNVRSGKCFNAEGIEGVNAFDKATVFVFDQNIVESAERVASNKNLECTDLRNIDFKSEFHSEASYVHLKNWNLRGARVDGSNMKWMYFISGTLEGVDFSNSVLGYTLFKAVKVDARTRGLRENCAPPVGKNHISCQM